MDLIFLKGTFKPNTKSVNYKVLHIKGLSCKSLKNEQPKKQFWLSGVIDTAESGFWGVGGVAVLVGGGSKGDGSAPGGTLARK